MNDHARDFDFFTDDGTQPVHVRDFAKLQAEFAAFEREHKSAYDDLNAAAKRLVGRPLWRLDRVDSERLKAAIVQEAAAGADAELVGLVGELGDMTEADESEPERQQGKDEDDSESAS